MSRKPFASEFAYRAWPGELRTSNLDVEVFGSMHLPHWTKSCTTSSAVAVETIVAPSLWVP